MSTEKDYNELSNEVYYIDPKHKDYDPNIKEGKIRRIKGENYKVLKVEDNPSNGMQTMAVAPVKNGKADTSEITIAYAGANPADFSDIQTVGERVLIN